MTAVTVAAWILAGLPVALGLYAYAGYPTLLKLLGLLRPPWTPPEPPETWPMVSVSLPAHNEVDVIRGTLEALVESDYPQDRLQILVVSDASDDGTDDIVREFADRGVELLRLPERSGKTAAENAAVSELRGDVVVNMDASIRVPPGSIKALVRALGDPSVGVASGRDVSVAPGDDTANVGESGYVDYEMWVRELETRVGSIVGASGCFYAIRSGLHEKPLPPELSRDFAAALVAREEGFRSVSVSEGVCLVPRTGSLERELRRKVRTMARGLGTLFHKRHLLDPFRYGRFAWMLFSHKLCRWLVPLSVPTALAAAAWLAWSWAGVPALGALAAGGLAVAAVCAAGGGEGRPTRPAAAVRYVVYGVIAGVRAWGRVLAGGELAVWEPTRREGVSGSDDGGSTAPAS